MANKDDIISERRAVVDDLKRQTETQAKRGGQKGHQRKLREPLPPERVNEEITNEIGVADVREPAQ